MEKNKILFFLVIGLIIGIIVGFLIWGMPKASGNSVFITQNNNTTYFICVGGSHDGATCATCPSTANSDVKHSLEVMCNSECGPGSIVKITTGNTVATAKTGVTTSAVK